MNAKFLVVMCCEIFETDANILTIVHPQAALQSPYAYDAIT